MGGDEIVGEWLGDIYANDVTTTSVVQRFSASSLRLRNVKIWNSHATHTAYIGKYYSSVVTFADRAHIIEGHKTMELEFIDLYELGFKYAAGGFLDLHLIGINEY